MLAARERIITSGQTFQGHRRLFGQTLAHDAFRQRYQLNLLAEADGCGHSVTSLIANFGKMILRIEGASSVSCAADVPEGILQWAMAGRVEPPSSAPTNENENAPRLFKRRCDGYLNQNRSQRN